MILGLIQVGGLGFVTIILLGITFTKQRIGLASRVLMRESVGAPQVGGIIRMTRFIISGTLAVEAVGAVLLAFFFCPKFGLLNGIYYAVFHSISAFCNAGFDLMGAWEPYSSLTAFYDDWYLNLVIMGLIVIGGLGFFVWHDLLQSHFRFSRLRLHSKLAVSVSAILIFGGAALIFFLERAAGHFEGIALSDQILMSLFQSVTSRTAGFNTADLAALSEGSLFVMICLMMAGGSTSSTAGGIKTTTVAVLILSIFTTFKRKKNIEIFGRRLEDNITRLASCIFMMYLTLTIAAVLLISGLENMSVLEAMFEAASAIATVGVTVGITPEVGFLSKMILAFLMIFGRAGSLTMLLALSSDHGPVAATKPLEKIQMG